MFKVGPKVECRSGTHVERDGREVIPLRKLHERLPETLAILGEGD